MTTVTIQLPGKAKNKLSAFVKELGGEVISITSDKQDRKKAKLLNEIKEGLKEVKEMREGRANAYSIGDLLDAE